MLIAVTFFYSSIVVNINKVITASLLSLPIFFFFLLEMKMGNDSKLAIIAFFSSIVVTLNKVIVASLLSLHFFFSFCLKKKNG